MLSQKEAVFSAVQTVFASSGKTFSEGSKVELSKQERAEVTAIVVSAIHSGEVAFSDSARSKYDSDEKLKSYVSGMVGNWLTKDTRLNGGGKYSPKNPGSRAGQGDEIISNLRSLRATLTEKSQIEAVDAEIEKRKLSLAQSKTKKVQVNFDSLPQELLDKLNIAQ